MQGQSISLQAVVLVQSVLLSLYPTVWWRFKSLCGGVGQCCMSNQGSGKAHTACKEHDFTGIGVHSVTLTANFLLVLHQTPPSP